MKYKRFSLIEILVVIAIIAILAALLMPAITAVRNSAKKTQARGQMNAIMTAVKTYESTYGVLPIPATWANADIGTPYNQLMELLTCVKVGATQTGVIKNIRNIRFLDVPNNYSTLGYVDPWSNKYLIYMDTDYDGAISSVGPINETLYGTVFLYSTAGLTNVAANYPKYIYTWK